MASKRTQQAAPDQGLECCARCAVPTTAFTVRWPEGPICAGCYRRAKWRSGVCAQCKVQRQLPGLNKYKEPICADCGSIPLDQYCSQCGQEAYIAKSKSCHQCLLEERIGDLFPQPGVLDPPTPACPRRHVAPSGLRHAQQSCLLPAFASPPHR